jgi:GH15 family glucan-1,4-alpha-glucosidase
MIGDCQTAALVGRDGSIDWLCFPWFDSGACFAALLGDQKNGRWLLRPAGDAKASRWRYRGDTLILETDYETAEGAVTVVDCMPPRDEAPDLVRMVIGRHGRVRMKMELVIRFDYGWVVPWVRRIEGEQLAIPRRHADSRDRLRDGRGRRDGGRLHAAARRGTGYRPNGHWPARPRADENGAGHPL